MGTSPWEWLGNFLKEVILGRVLKNDFFFLDGVLGFSRETVPIRYRWRFIIGIGSCDWEAEKSRICLTICSL